MKKHIVLCADDYGQAFTVSQAIIHLIEMNRLTATSCLVNMPEWPRHAPWLRPFENKIDIGLHFNLTLGQPLSTDYMAKHGDHFLSLPALLFRAYFGQLDKKALKAECHAQIDCFLKEMGFLPRYIDGHQHIHQFPVIRDALIAVYHERLRESRAYIRLVNQKIDWRDIGSDPKKIIIYATGTAALKRILIKQMIPHNSSFAGIYSFAKADQYRDYFPRFLKELKDQGLMMCHPGLLASDTTDTIASARYDEYQYFMSDAFIEACQAEKVVLSRLS